MFDRHEYTRGSLDEANLPEQPWIQLRDWLADARQENVREPGAMCLSTVGPDGRPSARFVLLRELDERGATFATNYESRKGTELETNPYACITFWWALLERQVRIEGRVERVSAQESDDYFDSRPRESRFASAASPQSRPIPDRAYLVQRIAELEAESGDAPIHRPAHWGGYRLVPDRYEFWQGRPARLHDRIAYVLHHGRWERERLAP